MLKVLLKRLNAKTEGILAEEQAGFRAGRSTVEQIFNCRLIIEKHLQHQRELHHNFIDFKKAFDHFCIHAGGRAVIDGIQTNLNLPDQLVNPSRETLRNYGNTSSSSIWYELAYIEANKEGQNPLKRGDRILQIAFGSGFKCNSAVWMRVAPV